MRYRVEYRSWEPDDVYSADCVVEAKSRHEAITEGWYQLSYYAEGYGGTIDDLDAWEIIDEKSTREKIARVIFCEVNYKQASDWENLHEKEPYLRAADALLIKKDVLF